MAPMRKDHGFYQQGNHWFCDAGLPSDIIVEVEETLFHLHKFPLLSKSGKIAWLLKDAQDHEGDIFHAKLLECPGGSTAFLVATKFCYGAKVDFTPTNIATIYCVADYLEMTEEFGEENLFPQSEHYFHKIILRNWKDCVTTLQSCEAVLAKAEELQIVKKCASALSMMACTDPSLFGWPMMMYGNLQSPGGSILWNGINTGAKITSFQSDWWHEDVSYLSGPLFERLTEAMKARGMRSESIGGAVMHYARKHLPGLTRRLGGQGDPLRAAASINKVPVVVDQKSLLETIERALPAMKSLFFCRFLFGLLRLAMILNASEACKSRLERRIGMQVDMATLDDLLIPTYSDSDNLYDTDCVERIVKHFLSSDPKNMASPSDALEEELGSPSLSPFMRVARLIDGYLAEISSDVNLKPDKLRSLAEFLPESSRPFHDGLYRALDIYFKAHPWLSEREKEQLCNIISYQKLSMDACTHAAQNERLPLRVIVQVLFFEQLHLRTAIAGYLHISENDDIPPPTATSAAANLTAGQLVQRDGWVSIVRENQVLKGDMDRMRSRVGKLEQEFTTINLAIQRVRNIRSSFSSPRLVSRVMRSCKLLQSSSQHHQKEEKDSTQSPVLVGGTPTETAKPRQSRHRKSLSLF
ncbi:BTB/POZ domain-containing protein At3g44820 [Amborella trichopoda]|uniref:BTB/POZ domain-containing protein At3g44820 n=1 Tax=Amborella trichopoda TaxID=13333 RepID=UPI0005D3708A|nr:BTB/POZ domain-containing protein At3g44820 [Amborella trichopoda]|eukprot:XP_011625992.1 BTB/POZ domain-containing protein At3g44820 [Amborella trichopoda]